jgi:hypothetical protein
METPEALWVFLVTGGTSVVYRGGWPVDCASSLFALVPYPC